MSRPQILFVDMYGVITSDLYWDTLKDSSHELSQHHAKIIECAFDLNPTLWADWMRGIHTSEGVHQLLERVVGVPYDKLFPIFVQECRDTRFHQSLLARIANLRSNMVTALITDNMDCFDRWVVPAHPELSRAFHRLDNSYNMGRLKADDDGKYFIDTMEQLGTRPQDCIFIDDSPSNCETFARLGGYAHQAVTTQGVLTFLESIK